MTKKKDLELCQRIKYICAPFIIYAGRTVKPAHSFGLVTSAILTRKGKAGHKKAEVTLQFLPSDWIWVRPEKQSDLQVLKSQV